MAESVLPRAALNLADARLLTERNLPGNPAALFLHSIGREPVSGETRQMHQESGDSRMAVGLTRDGRRCLRCRDRGPLIMNQRDPAWPSPS